MWNSFHSTGGDPKGHLHQFPSSKPGHSILKSISSKHLSSCFLKSSKHGESATFLGKLFQVKPLLWLHFSLMIILNLSCCDVGKIYLELGSVQISSKQGSNNKEIYLPSNHIYPLHLVTEEYKAAISGHHSHHIYYT